MKKRRFIYICREKQVDGKQEKALDIQSGL